MLYVSKRIENGFEITDTEDGVSEAVTYAELVKLVYSGLTVEGTHWSTREDLKAHGFARVEPLGYLYTIKLKCGNCYKVTFVEKYGNRNKQEIIGCLRTIDTNSRDLCSFVQFNNKVCNIYYSEIVSVEPYTQRDAGLQKLMQERLYLSNLLVQKEAQCRALNNEIHSIKQQISSYDEKFANYGGVLTKVQFYDYITKHLPEKFKRYGYSLDYPCCVGVKQSDICITYSKDLDRMGRDYNNSLFYMEYDCTLHLESNYRETQEFKSIASRNRVIVPGCKLPFNESLWVGDKYFGYQCWYTIELEGKTLTESLAKEIIKSLS